MQIEAEIRKIKNAIAAQDEKIDVISLVLDDIQDNIIHAYYGIGPELVGIQTKLEIFLGYPLTYIDGLPRKMIEKEEPNKYKEILKAEEAAGMSSWTQSISMKDYFTMLKNGYGTRKNCNVQDDRKELTPADNVDKKAIIRHAMTTFKTIKEISAETGIPERTVYRLIPTMLQAGEIQSDDGRPEKFMVVNPSSTPPFEVANV